MTRSFGSVHHGPRRDRFAGSQFVFGDLRERVLEPGVQFAAAIGVQSPRRGETTAHGLRHSAANILLNHVAEKSKEGYIDHKLWVPLEITNRLQQSGQVGQEVYGSAAAFVATSLTYQRDSRCPILIFCE